MALRITLSVLFFGSIFMFPWYLTALFGVALLAWYVGYEVVFGGVVLDLAYGAPVSDTYIGSYIFTILFGLLFIFSVYIKRRLIFYT